MIFRTLAIAAPSPAAQRAFYEEVLELPITSASEHEVSIQVGESEVVFRQALPGTAPSYHFAFRIPGNQSAEAKRWLAERSQLLRRQGKDEFGWDFWSASAVYTRDPAGNIVELIAFRGLAEAGGEPFTSAFLLGLAEVGLPVRDVHAAVAELGEAFQIGLWDRASIVPGGITPIGERGASFIVVPLGHRWFLGCRSGNYPLEIVLGGVKDDELRLPGHPVHIFGQS